MELTQTTNYIFEHSFNITPKQNLTLFDLDGTLIKTKSGNTFPKHHDDWILFNNQVENILKTTSNTTFGIISNQSGLKTIEQQNNWITKIDNIISNLPIDFVFASLKHDKLRKPFDGSWHFIKTSLFENHTFDKIIYVGDAFGRINDHSDTDFKFALNCGFKYNVPELYFKQNGYQLLDYTVSTPELEYYTTDEFNDIINTIENYKTMNDKLFIVMVGLPASGKTYLRNYLIKHFENGVSYLNNDENKKNVKMTDIIINDNTNLIHGDCFCTIIGYETLFIKFNHSLETLEYLNNVRTYIYDKYISSVVYKTMNKKMTPIGLNCEVVVIDKLFPEFDDFKNKLKYFL